MELRLIQGAEGTSLLLGHKRMIDFLLGTRIDYEKKHRIPFRYRRLASASHPNRGILWLTPVDATFGEQVRTVTCRRKCLSSVYAGGRGLT